MKIFQMNEDEWWRAESLEAAIALLVDDVPCGTSRQDVLDENPRELTEEELDKLMFIDAEPDAEEPEGGWPTRTFREELAAQDAAGLEAGIFAESGMR